MSSVYSLEPDGVGIGGKVTIITNNYGPIEIFCWTKECPIISKFFLQLCLDGYYDNMVFHRIMPKFLIQTGLIRKEDNKNKKHIKNMNSNNKRINDHNAKLNVKRLRNEYFNKIANVKEAYDRSKYELHSRIKFNHRGQVAMALDLSSDYLNDNNSSSNSMEGILQKIQPQFFITLDEAPYLDKKHVIFGTVSSVASSSNTIFNVIRLSNYVGLPDEEQTDVDNDEDDQEKQAQRYDDDVPKIKSIIVNDYSSFPALQQTPNNKVPWKYQHGDGDSNTNDIGFSSKVKKKKNKRKGKRDANVLSFGNEFDDDDNNNIDFGDSKKDSNNNTGIGGSGGGMVSSHDVIKKKKKLKKQEQEEQSQSQEVIVNRDIDEMSTGNNKIDSDNDKHRKDKKEQVHHCKNKGDKHTDQQDRQEKPQSTVYNSKNNDSDVVSGVKGTGEKKIDDIHNQDEEKVIYEDNSSKTKKKLPKSSRSNFSSVEAMRAKYTKNSRSSKNDKKQRQDDTMARLFAFQNKVRSKVNEKKKQGQQEEEEMEGTKSLSSSQRPQQHYHGQVLDDDDDDNNEGWLGTKFQCKKHIDYQSKGVDHSIDDYVVLDEKEGDKKEEQLHSDRRNNSSNGRRHHHRSNYHKKKQHHHHDRQGRR